jgi:hypothetical protein
MCAVRVLLIRFVTSTPIPLLLNNCCFQCCVLWVLPPPHTVSTDPHTASNSIHSRKRRRVLCLVYFNGGLIMSNCSIQVRCCSTSDKRPCRKFRVEVSIANSFSAPAPPPTVVVAGSPSSVVAKRACFLGLVAFFLHLPWQLLLLLLLLRWKLEQQK